MTLLLESTNHLYWHVGRSLGREADTSSTLRSAVQMKTDNTALKKVVIHKAGSYDRLRFETQPLPKMGPDDVLVSVRAIGVNYADVVVRMGLYQSAKDYVGWPITPGFEFAGEVEAVGTAVTGHRVGDRVFGVTRFGGYATHIAVPQTQLFPIPSGMSFEQAAGFPAVFLTAYFALHELAHPRSGDTLLIHSAAGGVGGSLVQLGKAAGCRVVGVVGSSHKVKVAEQMGADVVIDKSVDDLWSSAALHAPDGYDVIADANGVATLKQSYNHLRPAGRLVVYGFHTMMPKKGGRPNWFKLAWDYLRTPRFNPLDMTNENKNVMAFNLSYLFEHNDMLQRAMGDMVGWLKDGRIAPPPTTSYPFEQVAQAHQDIESGQTTGKLVLIP